MAKDTSYMVSGKITPHFSIWEFANSLAKDKTKLVISPEFIEHVQMLEEIRTELGYSMDVSSGYRTVSFNKKCGGSNNSAHLDGLATDITSIKQKDFDGVRFMWKKICEQHNKIGGINFYDWGVHLCSDEGRFGNKKFTVRDYRSKKNG